MTKRKPVRRTAKPKEAEVIPDPVLIDEHPAILNFEEIRLAQRGLDTFTIHRGERPEIIVEGHEIGMAQGGESEAAKLPLYQIVEYVKVLASVRVTRAYNPGETLNAEKQTYQVANESESEQYIKVVKAILWPGTYDAVTRVLGE
jgi:hypothetical protein